MKRVFVVMLFFIIYPAGRFCAETAIYLNIEKTFSVISNNLRFMEQAVLHDDELLNNARANIAFYEDKIVGLGVFDFDKAIKKRKVLKYMKSIRSCHIAINRVSDSCIYNFYRNGIKYIKEIQVKARAFLDHKLSLNGDEINRLSWRLKFLESSYDPFADCKRYGISEFYPP